MTNYSLKGKKRAQSWAIDVMIGAGIFILGLIMFFYIIEKKSGKDQVTDLLQELEKISSTMVVSELNINNPCAFIVGNKLDKTRLEQCAKDYNYSKILFGIKSDYCIYFLDGNGNMVNVSSITNKSGVGIGTSDVKYQIVDESGNVLSTISCT